MATKPTAPGPLTGQAAELAGIPLAETPRGGVENPFRGVTDAPGKSAMALASDRPDETQPIEQDDEFAGLGPWLEDDDPDVFKSMDGLVLRQELIALNHLAIDAHWLYVKMGYPWSTLTKEPNRSRYTQTLPYGSAGITIQAVPNKAWDLINRTTEALLVDFPQAECEPGDDSEQAEGACEFGNRFLSQDGSEQGTNDAVLFNDRVNRALTCASSYIEVWSDPTGGGYVPLSILAHPEAESPMNPLVGPDGTPTTDNVERYVTGPLTPDGQPSEASQFTTDPSQAAPQWQPKLRASKWERQHIRCFPETARVEDAEKVIILGYCTLGEGKRRWPKLAAMGADELTKLCDWTPTRFYVLLPPFQRARWALSDGKDKNKGGSSDERIFFYYHGFAKASPDYRKGADVVCTGAFDGGLVIDRQLLSADITIPSDGSDVDGEQETRCMEIPVVQVTPRGDPDELDPSGRAYIELFAGAVENNAHLAMSASEVIDKNLHLEGYAVSTSPVEGWQREEARASGDLIPILRKEDMPQWGQFIPFEQAFFRLYEISDEAINSIGSSERAAKGADNSQERSGKAIQLAVSQNNVSLSGMSHAVNNAYARFCRIKIEQAMARFSTTQQLRYVGEDGAYKQDDFEATDFALIGKVSIKAGTGSLVPPDQKVQLLANAGMAGILSPDEVKDAARPVFSRRIGVQQDVHEQRIERQVSAWLKGPPKPPEADPNAVGPDGQPAPPPPTWEQQWQQFMTEKQQYDQVAQRAQVAAQTQDAQGQHATATAGAPPAMPAEVTPALNPPVMPWTPFDQLPNDDEPAIATIRMRRLSRLMSTAKFTAQPPEWRQTAVLEYQRMRQVVAAAQQPAPQPGQQPPPGEKKKEPSSPAPGAQAA